MLCQITLRKHTKSNTPPWTNNLVYDKWHITIFNLRILKTLDNLAFPTQQATETGPPWTETSVYDSYNLLLKLCR